MRPLMLVAYARRNNPHTITPDELELINPDTPTPQPQNHAQTPAETTKKPATDTSSQPLQRATSAELPALPPNSVPCSTAASTKRSSSEACAAVVLSFNRLDGTLIYANVGHPHPWHGTQLLLKKTSTGSTPLAQQTCRWGSRPTPNTTKPVRPSPPETASFSTLTASPSAPSPPATSSTKTASSASSTTTKTKTYTFSNKT